MATTQDIQQAIDDWKQADKSATAAEKLLADASFLHLQKLGPMPSDDLIGDAKMLRALASSRLQQTMALMELARRGKSGAG
ncbi:MAG: hypothetical protein NVS3B2_08330 [Ramlibacter sp.]